MFDFILIFQADGTCKVKWTELHLHACELRFQRLPSAIEAQVVDMLLDGHTRDTITA
jgi:hypothetical protein